MDKIVEEAIRESVRAQIWVSGFIRQVKEGRIELTKEKLMEELGRIEKAKKMIRECEHQAVALPLEREDWDEIERELWGLVIERL